MTCPLPIGASFLTDPVRMQGMNGMAGDSETDVRARARQSRVDGESPSVARAVPAPAVEPRGTRLRRLPPVCALAAAFSALRWRLRLRRGLVGTELVMEDGRTYRVFRHLSMGSRDPDAEQPTVLVVRFRFARLSQRANRLLSLLPVPVIGGYPGFRAKVWMADDRGWWHGVYEWESARAVEAYRASLVFRTMARRAAPGTLSVDVIEAQKLGEWIDDHCHGGAR